jgi:hypothetical protein
VPCCDLEDQKVEIKGMAMRCFEECFGIVEDLNKMFKSIFVFNFQN